MSDTVVGNCLPPLIPRRITRTISTMLFMKEELERPILFETIPLLTRLSSSSPRTTKFGDCIKELYSQLTGNVYSVCLHRMWPILYSIRGFIVTEVIATPVYRRNYYNVHGRIRGAWFDISEASFSFVLVLEFLIKILADGFLFTPNAYVRSIWNVIDFIILAGILVNVTTGLIFIGGLSRLTRSLKALRALRLITLFDRMRNSFQSLIRYVDLED